ncbi:MAG TPA: serine/threonine-protein kinase [Gemmatimonadales bacterium]|nr:serine/threonine-protein kinase [Gemmatimonadales bacterium]
MSLLTGARSFLASGASLPGDLLEDSRKRIGIAASAIAIIWLVILVLIELAGRFYASSLPNIASIWPEPGRHFTIAGLVSATALAIVARRVGPKSHWLRDLAALLVVGTALMLALLEAWVPIAQPGRLSWVCLIILLYPLIVTDSPRRTLYVSLAAASTVPLSLIVALRRGVQEPEHGLAWTVVLLPPFLCAAIATVPAHLVSRLGHDLKRAREIGAYRLGKLLGEGGMGQVFRATHQLLARPAAVKLIRAESIKGVSSETARTAMERFRREAAAAAALSSPHTIALYDFGPTGDGSFFYAMELLEGMSLEDMVKHFGGLPPERVAYFLRQACLSLAEAHSRSLVHRDIKPSNLYACRVGVEVDFVKVLDFGLVKENAPGQSADVKLTAMDALTGTPAFMAPELALGDPDVDHLVDIYALGCTAYYLLTGELPFYATNTVQMLFKQANEAPPTPSAKAKFPVPDALDRVVLACLAKAPNDRPRDAMTLIGMLDAIPFESPWTPERATAWWNEHLPSALSSTPADSRPADRGEWIRFLKDSKAQ